MDAIYAQYGAIGLIAALAVLAAKTMYAKLSASYDRERERADRLEDELRRLNEMIRTDYVETISRASQAMTDANRAVADALSAVRRRD